MYISQAGRFPASALLPPPCLLLSPPPPPSPPSSSSRPHPVPSRPPLPCPTPSLPPGLPAGDWESGAATGPRGSAALRHRVHFRPRGRRLLSARPERPRARRAASARRERRLRAADRYVRRGDPATRAAPLCAPSRVLREVERVTVCTGQEPIKALFQNLTSTKAAARCHCGKAALASGLWCVFLCWVATRLKNVVEIILYRNSLFFPFVWGLSFMPSSTLCHCCPRVGRFCRGVFTSINLWENEHICLKM